MDAAELLMSELAEYNAAADVEVGDSCDLPDILGIAVETIFGDSLSYSGTPDSSSGASVNDDILAQNSPPAAQQAEPTPGSSAPSTQVQSNKVVSNIELADLLITRGHCDHLLKLLAQECVQIPLRTLLTTHGKAFNKLTEKLNQREKNAVSKAKSLYRNIKSYRKVRVGLSEVEVTDVRTVRNERQKLQNKLRQGKLDAAGQKALNERKKISKQKWLLKQAEKTEEVKQSRKLKKEMLRELEGYSLETLQKVCEDLKVSTKKIVSIKYSSNISCYISE